MGGTTTLAALCLLDNSIDKAWGLLKSTECPMLQTSRLQHFFPPRPAFYNPSTLTPYTCSLSLKVIDDIHYLYIYRSLNYILSVLACLAQIGISLIDYQRFHSALCSGTTCSLCENAVSRSNRTPAPSCITSSERGHLPSSIVHREARVH